MSDWKDDKDRGPWTVEEVTKIFYNEGQELKYYNEPMWSIERPRPSQRVTPGHAPGCGYWHKNYTPSSSTSAFVLEATYQLLTAQSCQVFMEADTDEIVEVNANVKIPLSTGEYTFEVIAKNAELFDVTLTLLDSVDFVCATVVIPAGTTGATGFELFSFESEMLPGDGDYHLKISKPESASYISQNGSVMITSARIKIFDNAPISTRVQIPMVSGSYNYWFTDNDNNESAPFGYYIRYYYSSPTELDDFTLDWNNGQGKRILSQWQYTSAEIATVSAATFSVAVVPQRPPTPTTETVYIYWTFPVTGFDIMIYSAPAGAETSAETGTDYFVDEFTSHTIGSDTFTPVPGTLFHSVDPITGDTFANYAVDLSSLVDGDQLYWGGAINGLGDFWGHFDSFMTVSLGAGSYLSANYLTGEIISDNTIKTILNYSVLNDSLPTTSVALKNLTTDTVLSDSILSWEPYEGFSRKETVVTLTPECEYSVVVKCPGQHISLPGTDPTLVDAQLWLDVDPIEHVTFFNLISRAYDGAWDNWYPPLTWGDACSIYNDEGTNSIGMRYAIHPDAFVSLVNAYHEASAFVSYTGIAGCYTSILEDFGTDDSSGTGIGTDVSDSTVTFTSTDAARLRSTSLILENGHYYGNRLPASDTEFLIQSGCFLVCQYK